MQNISELLENAQKSQTVKVRGIELTLSPPPSKAHFDMVNATKGIEDDVEREYTGLAVILTHCLPDDDLTQENAIKLLLISAKEGGDLIKAVSAYVEFGNGDNDDLPFLSQEKPEQD